MAWPTSLDGGATHGLGRLVATLLVVACVSCAVEADLDGLPCPCTTGYRCILQTCQPDPIVRDTRLASWSDIDPGANRRPTITIDDSIYPDEKGVRFLINGEVDVRSTTARPNGYDATGPQDDSEFHIYPNVDLSVGDELEAHWSDRGGSWRASVYVVGADTAGSFDASTND